MIELRRTVRFSINPTPQAQSDHDWGHPTNSFSAYPTMRGLGRHYELEVRCRGEIDPATGYFIDIKTIDRATRRAAIPRIAAACERDPHADPASILRDLLPHLADALHPARLASVRWLLSPYYSVQIGADDMSTALLRQQFEFAAAHRLHVPSLSDEENRRLFGRCNNPSGHGHNYRVEPCVEIPIPPPGHPPAFSLLDLERLTKAAIIDRFDHTNLNTDTEEFGDGPGRVNPSVENIARVCFDRLAAALAASKLPGKLRSITVWETDKTSCTYPA